MEKRLSSGSRADEKKKKKDHTRQMRARSSDYVGCVKSKVSRWFSFFFFLDGFDRWTIWRKGSRFVDEISCAAG